MKKTSIILNKVKKKTKINSLIYIWLSNNGVEWRGTFHGLLECILAILQIILLSRLKHALYRNFKKNYYFSSVFFSIGIGDDNLYIMYFVNELKHFFLNVFIIKHLQLCIMLI